MPRLTVFGGLATAVGMSFLFGTSTPASAEPSDPPCVVGSNIFDRFNAGGGPRRRCAVEALTTLQDETPAFADVRRQGRLLGDFYAARSERQQTLIDTGAGVTGVGALGYAFSAPAGAVTQSYWGYGALLPIILVQFNANEPTQDLYFAGSIAVDLITDRYDLMETRLNQLEGAVGDSAPIDCQAMAINHRLVSTWPAGDNKSAMLPVASALATRCRDIWSSQLALSRAIASAKARRANWPRSYARDLVRLENQLRERDARLRTSPSEALTMMVSTPLRALDALISGQNAQAAIDSITVQNSLSGLGFVLEETQPQRTVSALSTAYDVPVEAAGRVDLVPVEPQAAEMGRAGSAGYDPGSAARAIMSHSVILEDARGTLNDRLDLLRDLQLAAEARVLAFSYDLQAGRVNVVLRTLAAVQAAQQPALVSPQVDLSASVPAPKSERPPVSPLF